MKNLILGTIAGAVIGYNANRIWAFLILKYDDKRPDTDKGGGGIDVHVPEDKGDFYGGIGNTDKTFTTIF